ncbi:MAG: GGDEF domain-containing protein [Methylophaga nitratireducenticrescens]|uniref:GGDEF domain-containing protein n=1 Tax=Methylophaga sp. SB9B TaxID=2570356 RepID=UPI0010A86E8F|nr:GGDEF domain-containing protein [Methylophaga sp. SB9B]THF61965.1 MAG: GGDEF domain-containing protein [Methylophaga nitratireducenticrescens]THK41411.1 GGDEF domain-containing protein [Methylophaga sp. SB9B]
MSTSSSFPPVYTEAFHQASENLRRTLPFINQHQTPVNPVNYAVWYEYVAGSNQQLKKAIDTRLQKQQKITPELTQKLYEKYVLMGLPEKLEATNNGLRLVVDNTMNQINKVELAAGDFSEDLAIQQTKLEQTEDISEIKSVLSEILQNTRKLGQSSSDLKQELAATTQEILRLRAELEIVKQQAKTDGLTGLLNRSCLNKKLTELCHEGEKTFTLGLFDIDHFKQVNDKFGHLLGDRVLQYFASLLKKHCHNQSHIAARFGGEEMAVIFIHTPAHLALEIADIIRQQLASSNLKKKDSDEPIGTVTVSVGLSQYQPGDTTLNIIERADVALYESKAAGRNCITLR